MEFAYPAYPEIDEVYIRTSAMAEPPCAGEWVLLNTDGYVKVSECKGYRPGGIFVVKDVTVKEYMIRQRERMAMTKLGPLIWGEYGRAA